MMAIAVRLERSRRHARVNVRIERGSGGGGGRNGGRILRRRVERRRSPVRR